MILITDVFPKLRTVKIFVRKLSQEHRLRTGSGSQHVKVTQMLAKFPRDYFYRVFFSFSVNFIRKMSPLLLGEILGLFVNTLTADGKYPVQGCENLQLPSQMQLSQKPKYFSGFFVPFLETTSNFK